MKINVLDESTINKISAGEVVERPSSIIKELVENSIDSGATKIIIEIIDGGKSFIKVSDNGCGILSSEVDKSVLRHATSKISKIDDLYDLYSLGFRGEALSSICAVSKFEMNTKEKSELVGSKLLVYGGKKISKEAIGFNNGTTIIVKDLFFNTPARSKFLKSNQAESINITELVNKFAVLNPNINFKYINNKKQILNTPGDNNLISVIRTVFGREICENLIKVDYEGKNLKINGFIGNNNIYRSNKNNQFICINKRIIKSKILQEVISEVYKGIIPINKHAICFLDINLDPKSIDVNIHPTKLEVKFENEKEICFEFKNALSNSLLKTNLIGKNNLSDKLYTPKEETFEKVFEIESSLKKEIQNFKDNNLDINKNFQKSEVTKKDYKESLKENVEEFKIFDDIKNNLYEENKNIKNEAIKNEVVKEAILQEEFFENEQRVNFLDYKIVGTIFDTYVILEHKEKMFLLDQHASHEKVLYENYMEKFKNKEISMQILIEPIVMQLNNIDVSKIENNLKLFYKFGFEIELFGKNHIVIRSVPSLFNQNESEKFILEIIDNLDKIESVFDLKQEKIISMACKSAIKANDKIKTLEIKTLLKNLNNCKNPFTCPHGRPIIVEITKKDIEKMFKRIM